jgi:hypothetical protein
MGLRVARDRSGPQADAKDIVGVVPSRVPGLFPVFLQDWERLKFFWFMSLKRVVPNVPSLGRDRPDLWWRKVWCGASDPARSKGDPFFSTDDSYPL